MGKELGCAKGWVRVGPGRERGNVGRGVMQEER